MIALRLVGNQKFSTRFLLPVVLLQAPNSAQQNLINFPKHMPHAPLVKEILFFFLHFTLLRELFFFLGQIHNDDDDDDILTLFRQPVSRRLLGCFPRTNLEFPCWPLDTPAPAH